MSLARSGGLFDLDEIDREITELEENVAQDGFWNDREKATAVLKKKKILEDKASEYKALKRGIKDSHDEADIIDELAGEGTEKEELEIELSNLDDEISKLEEKASDIKLKVLLSGEYDSNDAIISIHAGTGGVDAMDWAEMMLRMYMRYCEKKGFKVDIINIQNDTEAGIKSATLFVRGANAYGLLKCEQGVHRLVRISPFNAAGKRQTSFSALEVTPDLGEDISVDIDQSDLKIDTYRSSGAGGQHVNTTDSAIRITHIPTGIVVTCQNERSQLRNKEVAMKILASKLYKLALEEHKKNINELKGDMSMFTWGSQIRSYVFQPYTMVKDHRTGAEVGNVSSVIDGELDIFVKAKLIQDAKEAKE